MRATRESKRLSDVIKEVKYVLATEHGFTQEKIDAERRRVDAAGKGFPIGSHMVAIDRLSIDYTVQRDVVVKHILSIVKRYDPRICSPASACTVSYNEENSIFVYDGQHRIVATGVLGFLEIPIIINETSDESFPSYAFEECNMSTKKLGPGDIHRNRLTRYDLGAEEQEVLDARTLQDQFDKNDVDLEDKGTRRSEKLRGSGEYFFSHFKYAMKAVDVDKSGKMLDDILGAITTAYPKDEEISQDLFIGLLELHRLDSRKSLPNGWMTDVLTLCANTYKRSSTIKGTSLYKEKAIGAHSSWRRMGCSKRNVKLYPRTVQEKRRNTGITIPRHW
jgi:hypothetical protein